MITEAQINTEKQIVINSRQSSYNINHRITEVFSSSSFSGKKCFILGSGPSIKKYNLESLRGKLVISVNNSFLRYKHADINYFNDISFYLAMLDGSYDKQSGVDVKSQWENLCGPRVTVSPMSPIPLQKVYVVKRQPVLRIVKGLDNGIYPGTNSGFGAIMLAIALGSVEIDLIGFDFQTDGKSTHFHSIYEKRDPNEFNKRLREYANELDCAKYIFDDYGIKIYNLSPDSALTKYDFRNFYKEVNSV